MTEDRDPLMRAPAAAAYLGTSAANLAQWRFKRTGPAYLKPGRTVMYRKSDLDAWLDSVRVVPGHGAA